MFHYIDARMHNIPGFISRIGMGFIQSSIIHDNTCKLIHKECEHYEHMIGVLGLGVHSLIYCCKPYGMCGTNDELLKDVASNE